MIEYEKICEIAEKIAGLFNPDKIILFGSYAAGWAGKDSDVDLLIVKASDEPQHRRAIEIQRSLRGSGVPMDIIVYTPEEFAADKDARFSFIHTAMKTSRLLYERA
jgi:uncharacterized protein